MVRKRIRDFNIEIGYLKPGKFNSITDVFPVTVGHETINLFEDNKRVLTGVTAILPHDNNIFINKVEGACHIINGYGKSTGLQQIKELGRIETPIVLTNTLSVGTAWTAVAKYILSQCSSGEIDVKSINPLIGECNDGQLNDIAGLHVTEKHVLAALNKAGRPNIQEGSIGAGTGMVCYDHKGGIGTSSRVIPKDLGGYSLGAICLTNFGKYEDLQINGLRVGKTVNTDSNQSENGSIMIVIATDAPADNNLLTRIAKRAENGLARTGSYNYHGSGDFVIAFSTALIHPHNITTNSVQREVISDNSKVINYLFRAAADTVEEAILNSLAAGQDVTGYKGKHVKALPLAKLLRRSK